MQRAGWKTIGLLLAGAGLVLVPLELGVADRSTADLAPASECAGCHAQIAREWASSLHRRSYTDPLFQSGYRVDHRAFCRRCHAPRSEGGDPRPGTLAYDDGITCTECHRARRAHPSRDPRADWRARACADCHQFRFPRDRDRAIYPDAWMQRTADEHRASGTASTCVDCHMRGEGELDHTFAMERERIAGAVAIDAHLVPRGSSTEVVVRVANTGAGHAVPTGDVLRALELEVWALASPHSIARATLTRRFETSLRFDPTTGLRGELVEHDTRVPPSGAREERFVLPGRVDAVGYRIDYLRMGRGHAAAQGVDDAENRIHLYQGMITP